MTRPTTLSAPATPHGSQYGYVARNSERPKSQGNACTGSESVPPRVGPMMLPMAYMSGRKEKAL